ncbi:WecB/TagA/CpsF family glycosyltransferase [Mucilaginibacter gotjawali]|uniref:N-acetylglucosaminyldiphosphoundecaprenol N-acetyl-beta-D-mannosaminyltransferase n=1 Tax=Mucilaginibacter gotjawali TaxID=1550579 RepID=A0A839S8Q4_9SPHI|nr:WecB/TagA/CpsF family glycosyltransferase [Mucilaginibacter gotjawali]MBB3054355.1 N-acetylglucosaminyldiphosphoundecaprenol N-acetyl-beta-D-mannosaminyltransferase [Mucilaginibacter gotjawali]
MLTKEKILSINISKGKRDEFVQSIMDLGSKNKPSYVCVANAHMLVEAHWSKAFQKVVNDADIVTPDGMPLAKSFKILHGIAQERVDGMSLLPLLLESSIAENLAVYFYGGSSGLVEHTKSFIEKDFPLLNVVGMYSPPFRYLTEAEETLVIDKIANSGANIVFVALGCPKQEQWMAEMKDKIPAVLVGIGGALPVLIGLQKRAPVWMQKSSLEWLYRLVQEPRRLFKRYVVTNTVFLYLLLRAKIKTRRVEDGVAGQKISDPAAERANF